MGDNIPFEIKKKADTTVTIDRNTADKLSRFSKQTGTPKRALIPLMLEYFEKNGIDPSKDKSPIKEMQQVVKRVHDLWGFMKKQEQDFIKPLYHEIMITQEKNKKNFQFVLNGQNEVYKEIDNLKRVFSKLDSIETLTNQECQQLKHGLNKLLEFIDQKNKSGLLGKLFS